MRALDGEQARSLLDDLKTAEERLDRARARCRRAPGDGFEEHTRHHAERNYERAVWAVIRGGREA